jgi:hypothetical protein
MRWMPALTVCVGLAVLTGLVLVNGGAWRAPPWLNALFLVSAAGIVAVGVRLAVRGLRRQTDLAIHDAEHPPSGDGTPPATRVERPPVAR